MAKRLPCSAAVSTLAAFLATALLASCGGGDSPAYAAFANKCTLADEKTFLRGWTDDLYLWYSEVPNVNPASYATDVAYFDVLKTPATTSSGNPKDKFHFTMPTAQWLAFSQSGVTAGYGVEWAVVNRSPPRKVVAAFTEPGSAAETAGILRGAEVLSVDGFDMVNSSDPAPLNAALFPKAAGETHTFSILDPGQTQPRNNVVLTSANVTSTPVQNVHVIPGTPPGTTVGYILFNDHIQTSENLLSSAVSQLKAAAITHLVLDIRYNGGGYLAIASELAYMISGPSTGNQAFERLTFNDKHPSNDPVTGAALTPTPFITRPVFSSSSSSLPTLGLSRVYVLTGSGTCSASESIINGLRGLNIEVIQIGSTTCGKPYGFYPADNCGTTFFSIQFKGVNAKGFGDYADGFHPGGSDPAALPGCQVADDFTHPLGDPAEARLAAALQYIGNQPCPPATFAVRSALSMASSRDALLAKSPWRENRILLRDR
jgi:C-terminal processing protease CtpA/Prc